MALRAQRHARTGGVRAREDNYAMVQRNAPGWRRATALSLLKGDADDTARLSGDGSIALQTQLVYRRADVILTASAQRAEPQSKKRSLPVGRMGQCSVLRPTTDSVSCDVVAKPVEDDGRKQSADGRETTSPAKGTPRWTAARPWVSSRPRTAPPCCPAARRRRRAVRRSRLGAAYARAPRLSLASKNCAR